MKNVYTFLTFFLLSSPLLAIGPKGGSGNAFSATRDATMDDLTVNGNTTIGNAQTDTASFLAYTTFNTSFTVNQGVTIGSATAMNGNVTIGDASGDILTVNPSSVTHANDTFFSGQGGVNAFSFGVSNTSAFSIDTTNKSACVGTGCTAPDYAESLQVGENAATPILQIDKSAGGNGILLWSTNGSATNSGRITLDATEVLIIETDASGGAITITPTDTEIARFSATTVGINDTSADATLEVKSNAAATAYALQISSQNDTSILMGVQGNGTVTGVKFSASTQSYITCDTGNGHGTTDNKIRRFASCTTVGTDITMSSTAANAQTFTINTAGFYCISYTDKIANPSTAVFGISNNSNQLTTSVGGITQAHKLMVAHIPASAETIGSNVSVCSYLAANDVVRPHTDGTPDSTASNVMFSIVRIQ